MSFPPTLFLIGAQKSGTTYLASLLGQHPEICLSNPKEPHFFTKHWEKGPNWYRDCFSAQDRQFLLDASTSYSAAPLSCELSDSKCVDSPMAGVPERIAAFSPSSRFIYLMRDPVKRTYSAYWHAVRAGEERRKFTDVIRVDNYALRMGCYHYQLNHYFHSFDRDRFLMLFFEDFVRHPEETANACFEWLDLEPVRDFELNVSKHESYVLGPALSWLNRSGHAEWLSEVAKRYLSSSMLRRVMGTLTRPIPPMEPRDIEWLADYFSEPNRLLESEMGLKLPHWSQPSQRD